MKFFVNIIIIISLLFASIICADVCINEQCTCSKDHTEVHCDSKHWTNLNAVEFPSHVRVLTLVDNKLTVETTDDISKIENLTRLIELNLNQNPLATIPPFNDSKIRSLSLQDTSLRSAEFPSSYLNSFLETLSLSSNEIHSI
ncbi:unnamed protein product, partial [Rotaria sp. Silwood1]